MKVLIHTSIFYILSTNFAFAYIDPGTGGIIIQAIVGFIAAFFAYITLFWRKVKSVLSKIFTRKKRTNKE